MAVPVRERAAVIAVADCRQQLLRASFAGWWCGACWSIAERKAIARQPEKRATVVRLRNEAHLGARFEKQHGTTRVGICDMQDKGTPAHLAFVVVAQALAHPSKTKRPAFRVECRAALLAAAMILTANCQPVTASEVYKNWQYSFSVHLIPGEKICSQDAHGVTIALKPQECGSTDVYISAMFNGPVDETFPSKTEREVCGKSPILPIASWLRGSEWLSCIRHSGQDLLEVFYFNRVFRIAGSHVPWMFIDVDAVLPLSDGDSSRRTMLSLISRIAVGE